MDDIRKCIDLLESVVIEESFKDALAKFEGSAETSEVRSYIDKFKELTKRNIIKGSDKDIGKWIKAGWDSFKTFVDEASTEVTKTDIKKKRVNRKSDRLELYENDDVYIVLPLTTESSCFFGKNTNWCTAVVSDENMLTTYMAGGRFPVQVMTPKGKYSFVYSIYESKTITEVRDSENNEVGMATITRIIGENVIELVLNKLKENQNVLEQYSVKHRLDSPRHAMFIAYTSGTPFPEGESLIAQDFTYSLIYAKRILGSRFAEGEPSIFRAIKEQSYMSDDYNEQGELIDSIKNYLKKYYIKLGAPSLPDGFTPKDFINFDTDLAIKYITYNDIELSDEEEDILLNSRGSIGLVDVFGYGEISHIMIYVESLISKGDEDRAKKFLLKFKDGTDKEQRHQYVKDIIRHETGAPNSKFADLLIKTLGIDGNGVLYIVKNHPQGHKIFDIISIDSFDDKSQEILISANENVDLYLN